MKVAILGGSGKLGQGFATRLSSARYEYVIGSRDPAKGKTNSEAASWCDIAIVAIPYHAHRALLEPLAGLLKGKLVIDATVPLDPSNILNLKTASGKPAAEEAAAILTDAEVYAAFQTVSHRILQNADVSHDVLVAGPAPRKPQVLELIRNMNLRPIDAGPIEIAGIIERITVLLISINKQNKVKESGFQITGV